MINISIPDSVEAAMKLPEKEKQRELLIAFQSIDGLDMIIVALLEHKKTK
ncbi:MAG: hypothetical protein HZA08_03485 [Nitrospirae bacterium]|nr:hypothetical protein [Nitrospirota bacterium]